WPCSRCTCCTASAALPPPTPPTTERAAPDSASGRRRIPAGGLRARRRHRRVMDHRRALTARGRIRLRRLACRCGVRRPVNSRAICCCSIAVVPRHPAGRAPPGTCPIREVRLQRVVADVEHPAGFTLVPARLRQDETRVTARPCPQRVVL